MKRLSILLFAALSVIAQEAAVRAPQNAPTEYERIGLVSALCVAVTYLAYDNQRKEKRIDEENKRHRAEMQLILDENKEFGERVAAIAERALERLK